MRNLFDEEKEIFKILDKARNTQVCFVYTII